MQREMLTRIGMNSEKYSTWIIGSKITGHFLLRDR